MTKLAHRGQTYHWRECLAKALTLEGDIEKIKVAPSILLEFAPQYEMMKLFWYALALRAYEQGFVHHPENAPYVYDPMHYEEV